MELVESFIRWWCILLLTHRCHTKKFYRERKTMPSLIHDDRCIFFSNVLSHDDLKKNRRRTFFFLKVCIRMWPEITATNTLVHYTFTIRSTAAPITRQTKSGNYVRNFRCLHHRLHAWRLQEYEPYVIDSRKTKQQQQNKIYGSTSRDSNECITWGGQEKNLRSSRRYSFFMCAKKNMINSCAWLKGICHGLLKDCGDVII